MGYLTVEEPFQTYRNEGGIGRRKHDDGTSSTSLPRLERERGYALELGSTESIHCLVTEIFHRH